MEIEERNIAQKLLCKNKRERLEAYVFGLQDVRAFKEIEELLKG